MSGRRKIWARLSVQCFIAIGLLAGCSGSTDLFEPHKVTSQEEAAAVNLAVTLVAPWEEYIQYLNPKFGLTGDQAVKKVIPTTNTVSTSWDTRVDPLLRNHR